MATEEIIIERSRSMRYNWPDAQLNIWVFVMLAAASTILGIFAFFITVQNQLGVGVPWLFTFGVVTGALTLVFLIVTLALAARRGLIPGFVLISGFILFVLWLTTLIETAVQLFGPAGNVNANCNQYVSGQPYRGVSVETLAWITQNNICNCWKAAFSWSLIGTLLFLWIQILGWQVSQGL